MRLLKEHGAEFEAINYFETPLTEADLRGLLKKLGLKAREILRKDEPVAKDLGIGEKDLSDEEFISLMAKHPDLIQRPSLCVVIRLCSAAHQRMSKSSSDKGLPYLNHINIDLWSRLFACVKQPRIGDRRLISVLQFFEVAPAH